MRIFLTGASGLVGSAFARASARRGHTVTGIVGNFSGDVPGLSSRRPLDLTDESALSSALSRDVPPEARERATQGIAQVLIVIDDEDFGVRRGGGGTHDE